MSEQQCITITQKYNFPKTKISLVLPEGFFEQSLHSLSKLNYKSLQFNQHNNQEILEKNIGTSKLQIINKPIKLKAICKSTTIGAIDTSTIKIGETRKGILIAIRGAIIKNKNKTISFLVCYKLVSLLNLLNFNKLCKEPSK